MNPGPGALVNRRHNSTASRRPVEGLQGMSCRGQGLEGQPSRRGIRRERGIHKKTGRVVALAGSPYSGTPLALQPRHRSRMAWPVPERAFSLFIDSRSSEGTAGSRTRSRVTDLLRVPGKPGEPETAVALLDLAGLTVCDGALAGRRSLFPGPLASILASSWKAPLY